MARKQISFKFKLLFICVLFFFLGLFFTLLTSLVAKKFFPATKPPLGSVSEKLVNPIKRLLGETPHPPISIQNRALLAPKPVTVKINPQPLDDVIASFHLTSSSRLLLFSRQRLTRALSSLSFEITDLPQKRFAVWSAGQKLIAFDQVFDETTNSVKLLVYLNPDYLATLDLQAQENLINREIYRGLFFMANWENFQKSGRVFEPETIPDLKFVELSKPVSLLQKVFGNFEAAAYCDHGPECGWNRKDCTCSAGGSASCYPPYSKCYYLGSEGFCICTDYYCHYEGGNRGYCPVAFGGGSCMQGNCGTGGDCPPFFSCNWIPDYVPPNSTPTPLSTAAPPPPNPPIDWGKHFIMALVFFEDVNFNGIMDETEKFINPTNSNPTSSNSPFFVNNQWKNIGNLGYSLNCVDCEGHFEGNATPLFWLTDRTYGEECSSLDFTDWNKLYNHLADPDKDSFTGYTFSSFWLAYPSRLMPHAGDGFCGPAHTSVWMPPMIWATIWDKPPTDFRWRHQVNLTLPFGWFISPKSLTKNSSYLYPKSIGHPFGGSTDVFFRAIGLINPPNCQILNNTPDQIVVGQTATLNGRFWSAGGSLGAAIQVAYPTPDQAHVIIYNGPTPPFSSSTTYADWSTTWTPTWPGMYHVSCRTWHDSARECRAPGYPDPAYSNQIVCPGTDGLGSGTSKWIKVITGTPTPLIGRIYPTIYVGDNYENCISTGETLPTGIYNLSAKISNGAEILCSSAPLTRVCATPTQINYPTSQNFTNLYVRMTSDYTPFDVTLNSIPEGYMVCQNDQETKQVLLNMNQTSNTVDFGITENMGAWWTTEGGSAHFNNATSTIKTHNNISFIKNRASPSCNSGLISTSANSLTCNVSPCSSPNGWSMTKHSISSSSVNPLNFDEFYNLFVNKVSISSPQPAFTQATFDATFPSSGVYDFGSFPIYFSFGDISVNNKKIILLTTGKVTINGNIYLNSLDSFFAIFSNNEIEVAQNAKSIAGVFFSSSFHPIGQTNDQLIVNGTIITSNINNEREFITPALATTQPSMIVRYNPFLILAAPDTLKQQASYQWSETAK